MALDIRWTTRADIKLDQLIIYLESEWGESVVKAFMKKLYDFPEIGKRHLPCHTFCTPTLTSNSEIRY